jgi:hypothetical protein
MALLFYYKQVDCGLFKGERYDVPGYSSVQPAASDATGLRRKQAKKQ